jgi:hypothetical protein
MYYLKFKDTANIRHNDNRKEESFLKGVGSGKP